MTEPIQALKQPAGALGAPRVMPEQIRTTLLAIVTDRLIQLRKTERMPVEVFELERLMPAASWLMGEEQ